MTPPQQSPQAALRFVGEKHNRILVWEKGKLFGQSSRLKLAGFDVDMWSTRREEDDPQSDQQGWTNETLYATINPREVPQGDRAGTIKNAKMCHTHGTHSNGKQRTQPWPQWDLTVAHKGRNNKAGIYERGHIEVKKDLKPETKRIP